MGRELVAPVQVLLALVVSCGALGCTPAPSQAQTGAGRSGSSPWVAEVPLPGGKGGFGFDDLGFSSHLGEVLVPAGRTGRLDLIAPESLHVVTIEGFAEEAHWHGGHGEGITSVAENGDLLYVVDRTARRLDVVAAGSRRIVGFAPLKAAPDYVRIVPGRREAWVTEPSRERIEVFSLGSDGRHPVSVGAIPVPGGPESLVMDATTGRAYTHLWKGMTVAIAIAGRATVARWPNGCRSSRGIALDEHRGHLFVACAEGKVVTLDVGDGRRLSSLAVGRGVDIIAYDSKTHHLFAPAARSASLAIASVSRAGRLSLLGTVPTAPGAHCVTVDEAHRAYVCDPRRGRLLVYRDAF